MAALLIVVIEIPMLANSIVGTDSGANRGLAFPRPGLPGGGSAVE